MKILFNTGSVIDGKQIAAPSDNEIENTLTLRQASVETALRYGGTLTRRALEAMPITYNKKYVVVDTKVHYLMKGWSPSIPGWHTDGVPRGAELNPAGKGLPDIAAQTHMTDGSVYHLMVCGQNSLTTFIEDRNISLELPEEPTRDLYRLVTRQVNERLAKLAPYSIEPNTVYTWDWWELHTAQWAMATGWRYLIRVTESDFVQPRIDLNEILRFQNMVYVKNEEIGW